MCKYQKLGFLIIGLIILLSPISIWAQAEFIRGDVNGDGAVDVGDKQYIDDWNSGGPAPTCMDAVDWNDNGVAGDMFDALFFSSLPSWTGDPADPYPDCGVDPTDSDGLSCDAHSYCAGPVNTIINVPNDYPTIQLGIDAALDGDTVHIEADIYTGAGNRNLSIPFGRNIVIRGEGPDATIIDLQGLSFDGFVFDYTQEDNNTIIRDLSVRNGRKGLHLVETGPKLRNLKLVNNDFGIFHYRAFDVVDVKQCQFISNDTGIVSLVGDEGTFLIDSCKFDSNIYGVFGTVTISRSEITLGTSGIGCDINDALLGNRFIANNCNIHDVGDTAIHVGFHSELNNCDIQNNNGVIAYGAPSSPNYSSLYLNNCRIDANSGGIIVDGYNTTIEMTDTRYTRNGLPIDYYCRNAGIMTVDNCFFWNNDFHALQASSWTTDVAIHHSVFGMGGVTGSGIAVDTVGGNLNIYSNTISQFRDYGIFIRLVVGNLNIDSTVVANNINYGLFLVDGIIGSTNISCNDIWNNTAGGYGGLYSDQTGNNGNISLDPQFCDSTIGDYHVLSTSPCAAANNSCGAGGADIGGLGVGCEELRPLIITGYSPLINMTVTDPDGYIIGRDAGGFQTKTLFPSVYVDGPLTDVITISYPIEGVYTIEVVGQTYAAMRGNYAMGIRIDGTDEAMMTANAPVPGSGETDSYTYEVEEDWHFVNGDVDRDGIVNILDIVYLINCKYKEGPCPEPPIIGDVDDCVDPYTINILDIVYLINYKYKNGPEPCAILE